jgi:hypothetical protein
MLDGCDAEVENENCPAQHPHPAHLKSASCAWFLRIQIQEDANMASKTRRIKIRIRILEKTSPKIKNVQFLSLSQDIFQLYFYFILHWIGCGFSPKKLFESRSTTLLSCT